MKIAPLTGLAAASLLLLILTVQYPLQTTFPIGGDAARYISRAEAVTAASQDSVIDGLRLLTTNSTYPGTTALLSILSLMNPSWPDLFVWLMVISHLAAGAALAWLLYRINGWPAAAAGLSVWALATTTVNNHFEDGTLAQLLSLPFLFLTLSFFLSGRPILVGLLAIITFLIHPMSGLFLALVIATALLPSIRMSLSLTPKQRRLLKWLGLTTAPFIVLIIVAFGRRRLLLQDFSGDADQVNPEILLGRHLAPFAILASAGFILLIKRFSKAPLANLLLLAFATIALLLTYNNLLGIALFTNRFQTYLIASIALLAGLALPELTQRAVANPKARWILIVLLFAAVGAKAWQANAFVYNFYESPGFYARLSDDEQAAIAWLDQNAAQSLVVSTNSTRNSEWIPILADVTWQGLPAQDQLFSATDTALANYIHKQDFDYLVFFLNREEMSPNFASQPDRYPVVFSNKGARVISLQP